MKLTKRERFIYNRIFSGVAGECSFLENIQNAEGGILIKDRKTGKKYVVKLEKAR